MSTPEDMMRARLLKALDLTEEDLKAVNGDPDTPGTYAHARRAHAQEREAYMTLTEKLAHRARAREQEAVPTTPIEQQIFNELKLLRELIESKLTRESLTASGGICAQTRPMRDGLPIISAERGGITFATPTTLEERRKAMRKMEKRADKRLRKLRKGKKRKKG